MNPITQHLLHQMIGKNFNTFHFKNGDFSLHFQSLTGYGTLIVPLNSNEIYEFFFYSKEDENEGFEIHDLEIKVVDEERKKSWLPEYWGKTHDISLNFLGMDFKIKKIHLYTQVCSKIDNPDNDNIYFLVFESDKNQKVSVESTGVFDGEYKIYFTEEEINNHFDLKREDGSDFWVLKQIIE